MRSQYLEELLSLVGQVKTSRDVASEVRQIDVWFVPREPQNYQAEILGLLGKIATSACLLEPCRNPPTPVEVRPEGQLLLCCLRPRIDEAVSEHIHKLIQQELDWNSFSKIAEKHRVLPLLYYNLNLNLS